MKQTLRQHGFSIIILILALLVITAIGLGIWLISNKRGEPKKEITKVSSSQNQAKQPSKLKPETATDPSEDNKYLVIKEWGIRFAIPDELQNDVKYGIFVFSNGDQAAYFTSNRIVSRAPGGTCDLAPLQDDYGQGSFGGTIAITRSTSEPEEVDRRSFNKAGYWYTLEASNGGACYEGDTGQERGRFNSLLRDAIRGLEATK